MFLIKLLYLTLLFNIRLYRILVYPILAYTNKRGFGDVVAVVNILLLYRESTLGLVLVLVSIGLYIKTQCIIVGGFTV